MEILGCAVAFCCGALLRLLMQHESKFVDDYVRKCDEFCKDAERFCVVANKLSWK